MTHSSTSPSSPAATFRSASRARRTAAIIMRWAGPRRTSPSPSWRSPSAGNDCAPCNTTLDQQADWAREGVLAGGGTPRRFNTITVTDGIAMGHQGMKSSLVSREVIADSVELSVRGHCYRRARRLRRLRQVAAGHDDGDAAPQCAVDLRLWRLDPAGPLSRSATSPCIDVFEAVGRYAAGKLPALRSDGDREGRLSRPRRLRRPIYRQHHGLRRRGDRPVAAQQQHGARALQVRARRSPSRPASR